MKHFPICRGGYEVQKESVFLGHTEPPFGNACVCDFFLGGSRAAAHSESAPACVYDTYIHTLVVVRERVTVSQCHCRSCSRSQVIKAVSEEDTEQQGADSLALGDATSLCTIMASAAFRFTKAGALKHAVTRAQQCKLRVLG